MSGANLPALLIFLALIAATLGITAWSARRSRTREQFYTAGGSISGLQNGFAFAGDFLSAAAFLGVAGLYFSAGLDGVVYGLGALIGWPVLLYLLAERLRRLGRYTLTDVLSSRLEDKPVRAFAAAANLVVLLFYMLSQMVGAGLLIGLLLGIGFVWSVVVVGALMLVYVVFGGMVATTWVQLVKAVLLLIATVVLALLALAAFGFDFERLLAAAVERHPRHLGIMAPGGLIASPGAGLSLALTLIFGPAGLPHVLMRFFTVPSVAEARRSACVATVLIGGFCFLMAVIGYASIALLAGDPQYVGESGALLGGSNMAALHLARALGGDLFLGFVAAVAFATILAVVAGLTLAAAATVSHDLYAVFRRGAPSENEELTVSRIAAFLFGAVGIVLSVAFQHENITFLSATAMSVAASSTFPVLLLTLFWKPLTTRGAIAGGLAGLSCAVIALVLGPSVWVAVLHHEAPLFPYQYPTIVAMPLAFVVAMVVSSAARLRPAGG
ncbi:MAG: sodium/solute symporter [Steroidobacteraceae bacterium]